MSSSTVTNDSCIELKEQQKNVPLTLGSNAAEALSQGEGGGEGGGGWGGALKYRGWPHPHYIFR